MPEVSRDYFSIYTSYCVGPFTVSTPELVIRDRSEGNVLNVKKSLCGKNSALKKLGMRRTPPS